MSEYQYYEFQAIDCPLSDADRRALRDLSTRAQITATSFVNFYQWGDFRGDPDKLMERCFDLHLYLANWGSRRLMMKLPLALVDRDRLDAFLGESDYVTLRIAGETMIVDIARDEMELEDWEGGEGRLAALAPLRGDVLAGDLRLFYLLWLMAVQVGAIDPHEPEPMPGLGPMTGALQAAAEFFDVDPHLVEAAAERAAAAISDEASRDRIRQSIAAMPDREKTDLLVRLADGDPHAAAQLRAAVRAGLAAETETPTAAPRTVAELQARADAIRSARERAEADEAAAERQRQAEAAEEARQARLETLRRRGESAWRDVEGEIGRRNPAGYDRAAALLADLGGLAEQQGTAALQEFRRRLVDIRERHAGKERFIERLAGFSVP